MALPKSMNLEPYISMDVAILLDDKAQVRGDHPFLIWAPFESPSTTWSYASFADDTSRIASGLASLGVKLGDRVLVHLENCPETLLTRFACARLGAICVATNAMAAGPEMAWFAQLSGARVIITQPKFAEIVDQHCPNIEWICLTQTDAGLKNSSFTRPKRSFAFDALRKEPFKRREVDSMLPASIMFTTGTTSRPKGVVWTHANMLWAGQIGCSQQGIKSHDICQLFLPLFHVVGLAWSLLPALWAGATVVLQPKFSSSRYWPCALEYKSTIGSQVIFTSRLLAQQPVPQHYFRQWVDAIHRSDFEAHFKLRILGSWGMTEMVSQPIISDLKGAQHDRTIGRASSSYELRIVNEQGQTVKPNEVGHLLVKGFRGVSIFSEYFNDPKATEEAFTEDGYFQTGDLVKLHSDGSIEFSERSKDVIKVGGEGVSAAEIENVINEVSCVIESAVVARADNHYGEVAVAFVRLKESTTDNSIDAILTHCQQSLAKFKVPKEVIVLEEFPRVGFGKLSKVRLRELASK